MESLIITPLNIGDLRFDFSYIYALAAEHPLAGEISEIPMYSYHISIPGRSIIVDAVAYDLEHITDPYCISGYQPPPPLLEQLRARGIDPKHVSDVIITHAHTDHYGGLCSEMDGQIQTCFPNAQHYLNSADWQPENFNNLEESTLRVVEQKGYLKLVDGEVDLGDGLRILPMPGETPGHQILVSRDDETGANYYFSGDLYHHEIEMIDETINATWVDLDEMRLSKAAFMRRTAQDGGIVYFTHIRGSYRVIEQENGQLVWQEQ